MRLAGKLAAEWKTLPVRKAILEKTAVLSGDSDCRCVGKRAQRITPERRGRQFSG